MKVGGDGRLSDALWWSGAARGEFLGLLKTGADVALTLHAANLEGLFDLGYHLKQVDIAFERVFGQMSGPVEALRALAVII